MKNGLKKLLETNELVDKMQVRCGSQSISISSLYVLYFISFLRSNWSLLNLNSNKSPSTRRNLWRNCKWIKKKLIRQVLYVLLGCVARTDPVCLGENRNHEILLFVSVVGS